MNHYSTQNFMRFHKNSDNFLAFKKEIVNTTFASLGLLFAVYYICIVGGRWSGLDPPGPRREEVRP